MVMYNYVGLDTLVFDTISASSHTFAVPTLNNYEGPIEVVAMGTNGTGIVDVITLSMYLINAISSTYHTTIPEVTDFFMHPNPTTNYLHVHTDSPMRSVKIIDAQGRQVLKKINIHQNDCYIALSSLPRGIYQV